MYPFFHNAPLKYCNAPVHYEKWAHYKNGWVHYETRMHSSRMRTAHSSSCSWGGGPGPDPYEFPPWVWAWIWSPWISPLGVGLDLIPLNFPLGCGSGSDPPQFPPYLWAWTWSPSISPLAVGLDLTPSISPLGVGLEGGVSLAGGSPSKGVSLLGGFSFPGASWPGGLLARGVSLPGGTMWPTPPPGKNFWHTLLKLLPCPTSFAGGKNGCITKQTGTRNKNHCYFHPLNKINTKYFCVLNQQKNKLLYLFKFSNTMI